MTYQIRKLTRHYYAKFFKFVYQCGNSTDNPSVLITNELTRIKIMIELIYGIKKTYDNDTINDFFSKLETPEEIDEIIPKDQIKEKYKFEYEAQNYFFKTLVEGKAIIVFAEESIEEKNNKTKKITLSSLIRITEPQNDDIAELIHTLTNKIDYSLSLLSNFFGLIERYASAKGIRQLKITVSHRSPLIRHLANEEFSIKSHGLRSDVFQEGIHGNIVVELVFTKYLLLDFAGDIRNWSDFCRWYLNLLFGHLAKIEAYSKLNNEDKSSKTAIEQFCFSIKPQSEKIINLNTSDISEIHVCAISISKDANINEIDISIYDKSTIFPPYKLVLTEEKFLNKQLDNIDIKNKDTLLNALNSVKKSYLFKDWYNKSTLSDKNKKGYFTNWLKIKTGFHKKIKPENMCAGVIVEIDRLSYKRLIDERINRNDLPILFFNTASFGEVMARNTTLFFFVWDSNWQCDETSDECSGVLCAYANIWDVSRLTIKKIEDNWCIGENYSSQTIFSDQFIKQYFRDEVICFFLSEIKYFEPEIESDYEYIKGIPYEVENTINSGYEGLRDILCPIPFNNNDGTSDEHKEFATQLLPVWDIGNTYLDKRLVEKLKKKLDETTICPKYFGEKMNSTSNNTETTFQVFLSYNRKDKDAVIIIKDKLQKAGIKCWFDKEQIMPGSEWQVALETGIPISESFVAFFGSSGIGAWQSQETQAGLSLAVKEKKRIIPVILPNSPEGEPKLPLLLTNRSWVDFRNGVSEDGLDELIWGITGVKPK